jgi:solute carrier family 45 protein 1/2/4
MSAIGHLVAYGACALDLVSIFGTTLGATQFKQLTIIATCAMLGSVALTCWAVQERVLVAAKTEKQSGGYFKVLRQIWFRVRDLPPRIRLICWAQFWSWIGWFPFLFYSTTWVGETYFRYDMPKDARQSDDALGEVGRIGSTSLVMYSAITFVGAFVLPMVVKTPDETEFTKRPPKAIAALVERYNLRKPDLLTMWVCGHLMFSASMAFAPFARSYRFATTLVCLCGM